MLRFIHAADIHLDSPLRGLARYQGAPLEELQGATRKAFSNLVSEALRREVDLLLLAGDLFDGDWPDYNTGLFFLQEMARLERAGIQVVTLAGNHDADSKISKSLRLPSNVHVLPVDNPGTINFEELKVAVHGQGFAQAATTEDLTAYYPEPLPGRFNIGMLHTSADGRPGHDSYAPCSVETLKNFGYQYWALGHVHQREVLCEEPWILFCGNLQGRHVKESGPKGATMVTVESGRVNHVEELVLDVLRWSHLRLDISQVETDDQFLDLVDEELREARAAAQGRFLAFRVETMGRGFFHARLTSDPEYFAAEIRSLAIQVGSGVWFEKLKTSSATVIPQTEDDGSLNHLLSGIRSRLEESDEIQELGRELFESLLSKLPRSWRTGDLGFDPTDPAYLRDAVEDSLGMLEERLGGFEESRS